MQYTNNLHKIFIENLKVLKLNKTINLAIEIGCFEGQASNYFVDNLLTNKGKLICIDPLTDKYLNEELNGVYQKGNETYWSYFKNQYERFISNVKKATDSNKIELYRDLSRNVFPKILQLYRQQADFIYVDGDHRTEFVYLDAVNSFELCKVGGVILFDDYEWHGPIKSEDPKIGIDRFIKNYSKNCDVIIKNWQLAVKKK